MATAGPARGGAETLREAYAPSVWGTAFANVYSGEKVAQSFVAHSSFLLTHLELYVFDQPDSVSPDILQVSIAADAGGYPGTIVASTAKQGPQNWSWVAFGFYPWVSLNQGTLYWIIAQDSVRGPRGYEWAMNTVGGYPSGSATWCAGEACTWANSTRADLFFKVYGISGPALSLEVTPRSLPVNPGDTVPVNIWFNNSGNQAAPQVDIAASLSPELIYIGDNASAAVGTLAGFLGWNFRNVSVGSHQMTVWTNVDARAHYYDGESLAAAISLNYTDPSGSLNALIRAVASVVVVVPVLKAQVAPSSGHVDPGQVFNFTISFANVGSGTARHLWVNASVTRLAILGSNAASAGGTTNAPGAWTFLNVVSQTYAFNVTVQADALAWPGDRLVLLATLTYTDGSGHLVSSLRVAGEASIHGPSVLAEGYVDNPSPEPGDEFHVLLFANNTGDQPASHVWINASLPRGAILLQSEPVSQTSNGLALSYQIGNFAPGPYAITWLLQVNETVPPGLVLNTTDHVDVQNLTGLPLRSSSAVMTAEVVTPRFSSAIDGNASTVRPGDELNLVLQLNNTGNTLAPRVWVNLSIPDKLLLLNASTPWSTSNSTMYQWRLSDVGPGTKSIILRVEVSARLLDREDLVTRLDVAYQRPDGVVLRANESVAVFVGSIAGAGLPPFETILLWAAILIAVFLLFLLLSYMDVLPRRRPLIDDVFLLHNSGILICHYSTTLHPDVDSDIASGMLMAVRNFVADALKMKNGALQELRYGDYRIYMAHGQYAMLVVFTRGGNPKNLNALMSLVLRNVETAYAKVLGSWSGRTEDFKGVEEYLLRLVES